MNGQDFPKERQRYAREQIIRITGISTLKKQKLGATYAAATAATTTNTPAPASNTPPSRPTPNPATKQLSLTLVQKNRRVPVFAEELPDALVKLVNIAIASCTDETDKLGTWDRGFPIDTLRLQRRQESQ